MPEKHTAVLRQYCFECHDASAAEGGVDLESLSLRMDDLRTAETWQKVLNTINAGEMPPEDADPLSADAKTELLADLSKQLVIARAALADSGGVITIRRLNRREYKNTIESLLGVAIDVSDLPDDSSPNGFDTNGASLFFSSNQLEQYLKIARRALDQAIVSAEQPRATIIRVEVEHTMFDWILRDFIKRDESGRLEKRFYTLKDREQVIEFAPDNYRWFNHVAWLKHPTSGTGAPLYNLFSNFALPDISLPSDGVGKRFLVRIRAAKLNDEVPEHRRYLEYGSVPSGVQRGEMSVAGVHQVHALIDDPEVIEFEYLPTNREELTLRIRQRHVNQLNAAKRFFRDAVDDTKHGPEPALWLDWVEWEGPLYDQWPPASNREIFLSRSEGESTEQYHQRVLEAFATRAFRTKRPTTTFVDSMMSMYRTEVDQGASAADALKEQLAIVLASPGFLYLNEPASDPPSRRLSNQELAVRLSYFLWSGPPDEELQQAADTGTLRQPGKLKGQALRMLQDPRADEFIGGFAHQWLHMNRLDFFQFNYRKHPQFDDSLKESARREVYASIRDVFQNDRPIRELLCSDYVIVNDLLAGYYGIDGVEGADFRRVRVPEGLPRGGLLGMAAVMAMGSDGDRSSPVERGAWILRCLLNDPPPPAPANVPQLSRLDGQLMTSRELQRAHQEQPQCNQCHRKIDPLGFGLENFDAAGRWRDAELLERTTPELTDKQKKQDPNWRDKLPKPQAFRIDAAGTLPDGQSFRNYFELRERIAGSEVQFARGLTEKLIEYGLGRPYSFADRALADQMLARAKRRDYAASEFLIALIESQAFQSK
ncbi:MAG: DUF1592 domain-containing protein [Planctomycetota bacterium]